MVKQYTVVDTFSGAGGSSLGWKMANFKELLAVEFDADAIATFRANFPEVNLFAGDIAKLSGEEALRITGLKPGELDVFGGSPPCQSYSTAGKRKLNDPRGQLFLEYSRLLSTFKPKVFVFENVTGMVKGHMKQEYLKVIKRLRECGYKATGQVMNAKFYNVPQSRERVIIIGVRDDLGIEPSHPKPQSVPITPREAFKGLTDNSGKEFPDWLKKAALEIPAGNYSSKYVREAFLKHKGSSSSAISFSLLSWDRTAPAIIKSWIAAGGIGHPNKQRYLNLSELKRLASFPDDFQFPGDFKQGLARIGNCVPPNMMRAIAQHIRDEILSKV